MIWERADLLAKIHSESYLSSMFFNWTEKQQEEFLDFCCGNTGVKILYDSFFKEIMSPEYASDRLEDFLSLLLGRNVHILVVLPNDSTRIADESSLLITDIIVELEDGSIANVEVQKIGYLFPGERSACYSADLLLRQYKRVRSKERNKSCYKSIKNVYTIVLFEKSPAEFKNFPGKYIHRFEQTSDTGLELNLLQKYIFIPLDIFKKSIQNEPIKNKLDAWLFFFSANKPEEILQLIQLYPEFESLYKDIYNLCLNTEKVMEMFSKELLELDRNTVQYMIDEMQDTIDELQNSIEEKKNSLQTLKQNYQNMEQNYQTIEQDYHNMEQDYRNMEQDYHNMEQKYQSMEQKYNEALEKLKKYES